MSLILAEFRSGFSGFQDGQDSSVGGCLKFSNLDRHLDDLNDAKMVRVSDTHQHPHPENLPILKILMPIGNY
jgi:hypothetical protein